MPITALPQHTVQAIGSTSVITDPCSIVKELLDNALDASASSVFVEISQNTVDVIQVKDNGHGISPEDHTVVCKRTFTSKIETISDLRNIGGTSLGFRGEALASAAEMSGGLNVATRAASEMVGSSIKYGRDGEMISSQRVSHPAGTSVRITDFLKHIPVRRQAVLKSAGKVLSKIKKLLQAYAMCHPTKRLSLKVLKAKNEGNNFIYTGGPKANPMDAALKIAGTDVASHCTIKEWPSDVSGNGYKLTALLAKYGTDSAKVSNAGQYISVDGRPLASGRGIARDITKMYKNHFRSANSNDKDSTPISDPFLCLQIQCPPGSYDVNIEPAKDDVLFEDPQQTLSLVKELFCSMYGDSFERVDSKKPSDKGKEKTTFNDGFELLMARKSPAPSSTAQPPSIIPPEIFEGPFSNKSRNTLSKAKPKDNYSQDSPTAEQDLEALNPWSMTKLNTPFRTPMKARAGPNTVPILMHTAQGEPNITKPHNQISTGSSRSSAAPSPSVSNAIPNSASTSPTDSRHSPLVEQPSQTSPSPSAQSDLRRQRERDRERYGNGALDTWFQRITQPNLYQDDEAGPGSEAEPSWTQLAQERFGSPDPTPCDSLDDTGEIFTQNSIEDTQATPAPSQPLNRESGPPEAARPHQITNRRQEMPVLERWSASLHQLETDENPDLEQALDFEHRKREAMLKRREETRNNILPSSSAKSPHHSRYISARAALNNNGNQSQDAISSEQPPRSTLNPLDPRAYFMRQSDQQVSSSDGKARRAQTSKLPLEKIPEDQNLYDVCLLLPLHDGLLSNTMSENMKCDLYTQCGTEAEAFSAPYPENVFDLWRYRLSGLIAKNYDTESCPDFDFSAIHDLHESD